MPNWKKVIVSGSDASLNSLYVTNAVTASIFSGSFTGSIFGTASFAVTSSQAITSSYITGSNVFGPFGSNSVISSSYAISASQAISSSYSFNATSASYAFNATSASYTLSSSYAATSSQAQNASDILVYVKNSSGAQINKGKVVRIVGAVGDNPLIATASYENDNNSANTLGITNENIPNDGFGYVMTEGTLIGIDTSTFTAGQLLYLGATGSIIGTAPVAPLHAVRLGEVLRVQLNNGSMYVRIDNGYELGELHDVRDTTTTSSYGDLLVKSGSIWINSKQLTGSYGLTGSLVADQIYATSLTASNLQVLNSITASSISATSASFGYLQSVTGSAVIIGQEYIILNTQVPAARYAGLIIYDSGSNNTASVVWDSETNHFVYQNESGGGYSGGGFLAGPRNTGSLADITYPTQYRVLRSQGDDHVYDSNIIDNDIAVKIGINTEITGSLVVTNTITGSLLGTASYASQALSSSYAFNATSASYAFNATSASYAFNATSASYAISASQAISSSYALSSSYAFDATSASFAISASHAPNALTASFAISASQAISSSYSLSGSYAFNATSASYAISASQATTASYAIFALSASNAPGFTTNFTQSPAAATWSFNHNLNTRNPLVQVYSPTYAQIIPNEIVGIDANTIEIRFDYAQAGYAVASNGGGLYITGSTPRLVQNVAAVTWSFAHNLGTKYPGFEVYDSNDNVVTPAGIHAVDINNAEIYFAYATTGVAIANFSGISGSLDNAISASYATYAATASYSDAFYIDQTLTDTATIASSANGANTVFNQATGSFTSAFFKYTVSNGTNARSGEVMSVWNGASAQFTDNSTVDIGTTTAVTASVIISGANVQFRVQTNTAGWKIKSLGTFM